MSRSLSLIALATVLGLFTVACGGGSGDTSGSEPSPTSSDPAPTIEARVVSDEQYLAVICVGLQDFSTAIETETTEAGISSVIIAFIDELKAIEPPADVQPFHTAFIAFLQEAVDDPTRPLVVEPPLPSDEVRDRLGAKERSVAECREPTFFSAVPAER